METLVNNLDASRQLKSDSAAEARAIMDMARTDPFIWTLAAW